MTNTSKSIAANHSETIANLIITARQYEISHGQILAYVCAGGLLQTFLDHKKYGLQPTIDLVVTPTANQVITIHSLNYYQESHARDAEILILPTQLLSKAAYVSICQHQKEQLALPDGCTLERIHQAQEKLTYLYEEINLHQESSEFQIIDGYHPEKNIMFITALQERLDKFNISLEQSLNLLNREIKIFFKDLVSEKLPKLHQNIHQSVSLHE